MKWRRARGLILSLQQGCQTARVRWRLASEPVGFAARLGDMGPSASHPTGPGHSFHFARQPTRLQWLKTYQVESGPGVKVNAFCKAAKLRACGAVVKAG